MKRWLILIYHASKSVPGQTNIFFQLPSSLQIKHFTIQLQLVQMKPASNSIPLLFLILTARKWKGKVSKYPSYVYLSF